MENEGRIFLSAVTSEFGKARDSVAADLRSRGHAVTLQSDFKQGPDSETLLRTLHDHIRDCSAVVCIIGRRSGACPPPAPAERFADMLPAGITEASYTQWEFFFGRHLHRRVYAYIANDDYKPDKAAPTGREFPELQQEFLKHLKEQGIHYAGFSNVDQLAREVLKEEMSPAATHSKPPAAPKPIVLPYPSIGSLFKGRDGFMCRLRESLTRCGQTAIVSQALCGLGGIGKTRAAVEYAWAHADQYKALLFVIGETPEALRRNLTALASVLVPKLDTTDDEVRLKATLDWLKTNPRWFLILDNVDTADAMREAERLLRDLTGGHVVITSRLANFAAHVEPLELAVLAVDDAAAFLLERTKGRRRATTDDDARAREMVSELGQLALALEQAAAYIAKRRLTLDQYLEEWWSKRDEVLAWSDPTVTGYPTAVAVTWKTSVAQLSDSGRHLLQRLAWFAPEKVPESLLDIPIPGAQGENLRDAFDDLSAYSLVMRDAESPFFLVHRLVQDVTRRSLATESGDRSLGETLEWVNAAFPTKAGDVRFWPIAEEILPHARSVAEHAAAAAIPEPTARLMNQLGLFLHAKALYSEAEPLFRRALAIAEQSCGAEHSNVASALNNLATLLRTTNRLAEAEPLLRRALEIEEKNYGHVHPQVAIGLNNLAALLRTTNRLTEAEPLIRRALAISEECSGSDHPDVAIRLVNLAGLLRATNRLAEAGPLFRRALAIDEKTYGPDHPEVAIDLGNLATLLQDTNRIAEAELLARRALAISEKGLGPTHPSVATRLNNLGQTLRHANRAPEAEPLFRRALAINEHTYGPDHPNVAIVLNNLAGLLRATDQLAEAELLYWRTLAIETKSCGPDHPDVATVLINLAGLLSVTSRFAEAEPLLRRALAIFTQFTRATGHDHPHMESCYHDYAKLLAALGQSKAEIGAAVKSVFDGGF
jgi:tetratricopeptide (TPR) repeat protein